MTVARPRVALLGVGAELTHEISQLLFHEARLLDERRFTEWLGLLAEELHYWLPIRSSNLAHEHSGENELAHVDDDKSRTRRRVEVITSGRAWSEVPPSRTRHLISNIHVGESAVPDELDVTSSFLVYRGRLEREVEIYSGTRSDRIRRAPTELGWQIAARRVALDQTTILGRDLNLFF